MPGSFVPLSLLNLTPAAKADLQSVWRYTVTQWGEPQAEHYTGAIRQACHNLLAKPLIGKALPQVHEELRAFRCQHHIIFYLVDETGITFIAFLHERTDMLQHLTGRLV